MSCVLECPQNYSVVDSVPEYAQKRYPYELLAAIFSAHKYFREFITHFLGHVCAPLFLWSPK